MELVELAEQGEGGGIGGFAWMLGFVCGGGVVLVGFIVVAAFVVRFWFYWVGGGKGGQGGVRWCLVCSVRVPFSRPGPEVSPRMFGISVCARTACAMSEEGGRTLDVCWKQNSCWWWIVEVGAWSGEFVAT